LVTESGPDLLLMLLAGIIVTSLWRLQDVVPGLSGTKLPLVTGVAALLAFAFDQARARSVSGLRSPLTWLLATLCVALAMSTYIGINVGKSQSFLLRDFIWTVAAYVLTACVIRSVRDLQWIVGAHVAGAAVFCCMVFLRFRALDSSGRLCCVPYYDANDVSLVLVSTAPFFIFFFADRFPAKWRWRAFVALLPVLPVFQLAGSRGGMIGLGIVILLVVCTYRGIRTSKRVWSTLLAMTLLMALGGAAYRQKIISIFQPEDDYNMTEEDGRIGMWKAGIALARQRPEFGYGPRTFSEAYGTLSERAIERGGVPWRAAHNAYVELAAEAGYFAVLVFIAMLFAGVAIAWKVRSRALDPRFGSQGQVLALVAQSNAIGIVGYVVTAIFLSAQYLTIIYVMLGLSVALNKLLGQLENEPATRVDASAAGSPHTVHGGRVPPQFSAPNARTSRLPDRRVRRSAPKR
jgi:hypothetical protein